MTYGKTVEFKGVVIRNVYDSEHYKVYALDVDKEQYPFVKFNKYKNCSINGELPELIIGIEYEITAIEESGKHGWGYNVKNIKRNMPTTEEGTKIFLREILTPNQAEVLYENYPDIIDRVNENRLDDIDLTRLHGIGEKTFEVIVRKITENFKLQEIVTEFKGALSLSMVSRLYYTYTSVEKLKYELQKNPYKSLTRISGVGFKTADGIILDLQDDGVFEFGYDVRTSADRCLACVMYLLEENEKNGHTKMNLVELRKQCFEIVSECAEHFIEAIKSDDIYYDKDAVSIALKKTYETELYIAQAIVNNRNNDSIVWDFNIDKYRNVGEFDLSDEQMNAVKNVCKHPISILNGAAGTGKSQSMAAVINMLDDNYKDYMLLAPTGKASKVLADFTKKSASTIHRGLGYNPAEGWAYNKDNKLSEDIVIVDEFSMVDVQLFKHLVEAIDFNRTKLLIVGDNAQLPSVGCGNLLHDFMHSNLIPTTTLTKVFRYDEGGLMCVATDTRNCKTYLNNSMKNKATMFGDNKDYTFVDLEAKDIIKQTIALYKKLLNTGNGVNNIQVLTSKNKGDYGCAKLNNLIQKVANKNYGSLHYMKVGDTTYYKGDLVMQRVNNYTAELADDKNETAFVANGETAVIVDVDYQSVVLDFDGIKVRYYRDDMINVSLGYVCTYHKSQGSSIDNVILLTPRSDIFMLNSNLIYVGLTRMRKKCFHLGNLATVNMAVKKKANLHRNTFMQELLCELYEERQ